MTHKILSLIIFLTGVTLFGAEKPPVDHQKVLKVAVNERPPFCYRDSDSKWTGLSVSLWEEVAGRLGISFDYQEIPEDKIVQSLSDGEADLTPILPLMLDQRGLVKFTQPYILSHGVLATRSECIAREGLYLTRKLLNRHLLTIFAIIIVTMVFFSVILLLIERRYVNGSFSGNPFKSFGLALWFSAVTMTTVGYGDKQPSSPISKVLTFFWVMFGVLIIALFTGSISSTLTSADLGNGIIRIDELNRFDVGVVKGSKADAALQIRGISVTSFETLNAALSELQSSASISAVAGDSLTISDLASHRFSGDFNISLIPAIEEHYSMACRLGLPAYDAINNAIMDISLSPDWRAKCERWTGPLPF